MHAFRLHRSPLLGAALALFTGISTAAAQEPDLDQPNQCPAPGGQGQVCTVDGDCALHPYATACVEHTLGDAASRRCEIPCEDRTSGTSVPVRSACAAGETCTQGKFLPGRAGHYCQPSRFRMDLGLLDTCVMHFLRADQPVFSENTCSLEANLNELLDQDGNGAFDIFDLDLCVLSYLEQPVCAADGTACEAPDLVGCRVDDDCGTGLYCDPDRHTCQRDCGLIASREETLDSLERRCTGALEVCDYARGRCVEVDVSGQTCEADSQCPAGGYCLLGRCAPNCYRSVDCPGTEWYCTTNNKCRALPHPDANTSFAFEPRDYAVRFSRDGLRLDAVQNTDRSALAVFDLITRKQVTNNPAVAFGYRLELTYGLKQDVACLKPFVDCTVDAQRPEGETVDECRARQDDCFVDDTEQWVRLLTPFGTVAATGNPGITVELEQAIADRLSSGTYTANLRVIFDNGDSDSIPITLVKRSPSGEYSGQLSLFMGRLENQFTGARPLQVGMRLKVMDQFVRWNELLQDHGIPQDDQEIIDITRGRLVVGQMHGNSALAFTRGDARSTGENEIPFVGIYSPDLGRIHMIGVIEVPAEMCFTEDGACNPMVNDEEAMKVTNLFGRRVRRVIEFLGPFDDALGRFQGIYREKIGGLAADYDVTVEGGFIFSQIVADESALPVPGNLVVPGSSVGYPAQTQVLADLDAVIARTCNRGDAADPRSPKYAATRFATRAAFNAYLDTARRSGPPTEYSALGRTTVFPSLLEFSAAVNEALQALGTDPHDTQTHLNIYDFVSSRLLPCDPTDPAPPVACIQEEDVRCGLALHQKALVLGWVDLDEVSGSVANPVTGEQDLFCVDTIATTGCPAEPGDARALFSMQEHGRFWSNLGQILKFDADRARSEAFLVLFRNEQNPFAQGAALSFKEDRLRYAVSRYNELIEILAGRAAGKVLFNWPARAFKSLGGDWMSIMHTILQDRMSAVAELVDLKRRAYGGTGDTDLIFAHHVMQQEYLLQVYLMAMEEHWQGEAFAYAGEAATVLDEGQRVLAQLNPNRNALGITPGAVFFENSDPGSTNWVNYRNQLVGSDGQGGMVGLAHAQVDSALSNLRGALDDLDALEQSLSDSREGLSSTLEALCGDPDPGDPTGATTDYCQYVMKQMDYSAWKNERDCLAGGGTNCPAGSQMQCADHQNQLIEQGEKNDCTRIVQTFVAGTDQFNAGARCQLNRSTAFIDVAGTPRPCMGGEIGALLQEQALVDLQRQHVIGKARQLVEQVNTIYAHDSATGALDAALAAVKLGLKVAAGVVDLAVGIGDAVSEGFEKASDAPNCVVIAGLAVGTDCPQKAAVSIAQAIKAAVWGLVKVALDGAKAGMEIAGDTAEAVHDGAVGSLTLDKDLVMLGQEVNALVDEYEVLTQTSFNLQLQIQDKRFQAQAAMDRYGRAVSFAGDHLVGRESGSVLMGDHQVQEASRTFREIVDRAYRMTMAFIHHYNVPPGDAQNLVNKSLSLLTLDDVETYVRTLENRARDYCGSSAIDCDASTNVDVLRFSVREMLFPQLRDIVDGRTGRVVTAGEQFHNTITQPPYLRRRVRGVLKTDQVELPLGISLTMQRNTANGPSWLVDPLDCNQILDGRDPTDPTGSGSGNIAVNVVGRNLGNGDKSLRYTLARGGIDFIRACSPETSVEEVGTSPVLDYPIRKHLVGYAPQSSQAQRETPPAFVMRSTGLSACINQAEQAGLLDGAGCWKFFGRDRSLAAPDWKLIIPLFVDDAATSSAWVTGEGLPDAQKPIIEDIVLYFRYRSRPIEEP